MNERRETLLVLPSLKAFAPRDGRIVVTEKFLDGMMEYVRTWDGRVAAVLEPATDESNNLDNIDVGTRALPFDMHVLPFDDGRMLEHLSKASVVLGGADHRQNQLAEWCRRIGTPYVVNTEYTLATRRQIAATEEKNPLRRWRRYLWENNQERAVRKSVATAAGVQCNGIPTFEAYRRLNARTLLYFDTRVTAKMLPDEEVLAARWATMLSGAPLRLAFSGRLIAMKGADHLPLVARELRRLRVPFSLSIFGAGYLEEEIRDAVLRNHLADLVHIRGVADFKEELLPFLQNEVDLFVCPHRQGDPSCTYLETLACGVPIVGYANEAWQGLLESDDLGRSCRLGDPVKLAEVIAQFHADRETLARLSLKAWQFAESHTFERTFAARIEHLRECAGLPAEITAATPYTLPNE